MSPAQPSLAWKSMGGDEATGEVVGREEDTYQDRVLILKKCEGNDHDHEPFWS